MKNIIIEQDLLEITNSNLPWENFANTTILITGANGFLPAYMVETLLYLNDKKKLNISILALVRNQNKAQKRFSAYTKRKDIQFIIGDVCTPFVVDKKLDYIIHAASQASPKYYSTDPVGTLSPNIIGTYNLLELSRLHQVKSFLFFSSAEIYGRVDPTHQYTNENTYGNINPTDIRSCYAESKRMGETLCVSYHHQYNIQTKIVRPFHTYGPGMQLDDGRVFADFVADILNNRDITLLSDGSAVRTFCYLSDAVLGFFTILLKGESAQAYNISNPDCVLSIAELAKILINLFPEKKLQLIFKKRKEEVNYLQSAISRNCPDISKAMRLGWHPKISVEEGFGRTINSFLQTRKDQF